MNFKNLHELKISSRIHLKIEEMAKSQGLSIAAAHRNIIYNRFGEEPPKSSSKRRKL